MIDRNATATLKRFIKGFPIVGIVGPRQSGKSTLAKSVFKDKPYISLEDIDQLEFIKSDTRRFLEQYSKGAVISEVQKYPEFFSYLQTHVDKENKMGAFVLTGSQQFNLIEKITQSLAGRIGLVTLLPFSFSEISKTLKSAKLDNVLLKGSYPPLFDRKLRLSDWLSSYVQSYLERDVRQIINIKNMSAFQRFLKLCANRNGQILDLQNLCNECGITHNTARAWISVLEASFICFLLPPYFKNFNKRVVKRPKLYFYDSGLLCWLLGIRNAKQLAYHEMRGSIFEAWVISEFYKEFYAQGKNPPLYFWRDNSGTEIDLLVDQGDKIIPIEIKSSHTMQNTFLKNLRLWKKYTGKLSKKAYLIYGGTDRQIREEYILINPKQQLIIPRQQLLFDEEEEVDKWNIQVHSWRGRVPKRCTVVV